MDRRALPAAGAAALLAAPLAAEAQQAGKAWRIGFLDERRQDASTPASCSSRRACAICGYVEGRNIILEIRNAEGRVRSGSQPSRPSWSSLKVDVLVGSQSRPPAPAAKHATQHDPHRHDGGGGAGSGEARREPRAPRWERHGACRSIALELGGKRLELLKQALPKLSRVAVLWNSGNAAMHRQISGDATAQRRRSAWRLRSVTGRA